MERAKESLAYNYCHYIFRYFKVLSNFPLPQVKQNVSISDKHGIYQFLLELLNNLRLRKLGNGEVIAKSQNVIEIYCSAKSSSENKTLSILAKNI